MTRLEVIKANKKAYAEHEKRTQNMVGLELLVAKMLIFPWIKGNKWMGGLSDSVAQRAYDRLMAMGYDLDEIMAEEDRQMQMAM